MNNELKKTLGLSAALGSYRRIVSEAEIKKRDAFRRSIVASRNIKANEIITEDMIDYKRPGTGIPPEYKDFIIGKKAKNDITSDQLISFEDI